MKPYHWMQIIFVCGITFHPTNSLFLSISILIFFQLFLINFGFFLFLIPINRNIVRALYNDFAAQLLQSNSVGIKMFYKHRILHCSIRS